MYINNSRGRSKFICYNLLQLSYISRGKPNVVGYYMHSQRGLQPLRTVLILNKPAINKFYATLTMKDFIQFCYQFSPLNEVSSDELYDKLKTNKQNNHGL